MNTESMGKAVSLSNLDILAEYENSLILSRKSKKTIQNYIHTVNQLNYFIAKNKLENDSQRYIENSLVLFFRYGILNLEWSKFTHWTKYKNLNPFFKWCLKKNYVFNNPLLAVDKPKMPSQPPKALNENEVAKLLDAVEHLTYNYTFPKIRNKAIIYLMLYTGIRRSELLDLKMEDVDLKSNSIRIEHGKNDKYREVPLEQNVLKPVITSYLEYREKLNKTNEWVFNGTFGCKDCKLTASAIDILFRRLRNALKFKVTAHKLRHTFATFLLDNTGDIYTLKELMGHTKISTTCIYLQATRKKKIEAINSLSFI